MSVGHKIENNLGDLIQGSSFDEKYDKNVEHHDIFYVYYKKKNLIVPSKRIESD